MKTKYCGFIFSAVIFLVGIIQLEAADSTNTTSLIQESWETISNRWSSASLETIKQAAEANDVTAQYFLAIEYSYGNGVSKDEVEAFKWMKLAAQQGMARAQRRLGWMFQSGLGIEANMDEAKGWYEKAAQQGDVQAKINLGWTYTQGDLAQRNYALAEKWIRQAAEQGSADAQYQFGYLLRMEFDKDGHEIRTNFPAAAVWLRKAAEQGYAEAQYQLADMYHGGDLGDDQRSNCIPWFLKAAAQGNAEAQAVVGELPKYYPNSELLKSINTIDTLRQSGEQGNLDAQFQLARRYQTGDDVPQDAVEAFKWMQMAAQQDQTTSSRVSDAIYDLALMYEKGEGVTNDLSKARDLFLQAAAGHQSDATFRVGQMYEKGDGVLQDDHRAMEFYCNKIYNMNYPDKYPNGFVEYGGVGQEAIESLFNLWSQGRGFPDDKDKAEPGYHDPINLISGWEAIIASAKSELYLGEIYYQGKIVPQDLVEADARFRVAANQKLDDARNMLDEIETKLTPAQIEASKSRFSALENKFEMAKQNEKAIERADKFISW